MSVLTDRTQKEVSIKSYIAIDGDEIYICFKDEDH